MSKIIKFTTGYPRLVIAFILLITLFLGIFAFRVTMTTDIKAFFPEDDPRVQTYNEMEDLFGGAEYIMVALETENVFQAETLNKIKMITADFEQIEGVASVRSLTTIEDIKGTEFGLEISELIPEIPESTAELVGLRNRILNDEMYAGFIVSQDGTAALHVIEVKAGADSLQVAEELSRMVRTYQGPGKLYITGTPVLNNVLAESMKDDLKKMLPLVLAMIALILFLVFRDYKGVLLPFITVLISLVWTVGLMGLLNKQISPLNAVMPIILISLGNAYGIYILNRFREELKLGKEPIPAVKGTIGSVGIAVLTAGGTTVAGFAANIFSDISLMKDFGIFTSFGVGSALFISLTLIPAVLTLLKAKKVEKKEQRENIFSKAAGYLGNLGVNHSRTIIIVTIIIIITALGGLPRLKTDSNFFNFFAENSPPRIAYELVKDKFTGSESVEIIIEGDLQNPEVLKAVGNFQDDLEATGLVGRSVSPADLIKKTNRAMHENDNNFYKIPDDPDLIAQYLLLIEMNDRSYLEKFMTLDYNRARIQAMVKDTSTQGTEDLMNYIQEYSVKHFSPLNLENTSSGIIVLIDVLADMIIEGQIKGLIFALTAVLIIVLALLRSWRGSILSVLLISIVTLVNFGVMGWAGIPLDIVTVLISSIGVGVGIDYSIHIYARYLEEKKRGVKVKEAMQSTVKSTGQSIISNAGAVIGGFIILIFSSFPPFRYFGILVSLIMFTAAAGAMLWIPAMVVFTRRKN